jgi:N-acetylglucosaminyl-diphospho-decaprenol L-rhamnosyltransferase
MVSERLAQLDVVVATYNSGRTIHECLSSLSQLTVSHQIYVVDNESTDQTIPLIRSNFPDVTIINTGSNLGFGAAINIGVAAGQSPFVMVLNPDAALVSSANYVLAVAGRERAIVSGLMRGSSGTIRSNAFRYPTWRTVVQVSKSSVSSSALGIDKMRDGQDVEVDYVEGSLFVLARDVWEAIGGFSSLYFMYGEDRDLSRRALGLGFSTRVVKEIVFSHEGGFNPSRQGWYAVGILNYFSTYAPAKLRRVRGVLRTKYLLKSAYLHIKGDKSGAEASLSAYKEVRSWTSPRESAYGVTRAAGRMN